MNSVGYILVVAAGAYLVLGTLLYVFQSHLLYYPQLPSRDIVATPAAVALPFEPVTMVTDDDVRLDGWYLPAPHPRAVLLFLHGNAGNISHRLDSLRIFHELGLSVLIFDYRGYGRSQGKPSELGTYRDADAGWRYLTEQRRVAEGQIVVFGRSLGAAIGAWLAARHRPAALILESAFVSVPDLAADVYPFLPARWLSRFGYSTESYLRSVRCPVLVVHSRTDEIIPFAHGQRLFEAAGEPKRLLELRGGHNDGFITSGRSYTDGLDGFLTAVLAGSPAPPVTRSDRE